MRPAEAQQCLTQRSIRADGHHARDDRRADRRHDHAVLERQRAERDQQHQCDQIGQSLRDDDRRSADAIETPRASYSSSDLKTSPTLPGVTLITKPDKNTTALSNTGTLDVDAMQIVLPATDAQPVVASGQRKKPNATAAR